MSAVTRPVTASSNRPADGGVIRFERHLPYSIRDVWNAVTEPEQLAQWWLPFDADITVDLREGGQMVFKGRDPEEPVSMTMTVLRVEAPMLLEHTHVDPDSLVRSEHRIDRHRLHPPDQPLRHRRRCHDRELLRRRVAHLARSARAVARG